MLLPSTALQVSTMAWTKCTPAQGSARHAVGPQCCVGRAPIGSLMSGLFWRTNLLAALDSLTTAGFRTSDPAVIGLLLGSARRGRRAGLRVASDWSVEDRQPVTDPLLDKNRHPKWQVTEISARQGTSVSRGPRPSARAGYGLPIPE